MGASVLLELEASPWLHMKTQAETGLTALGDGEDVGDGSLLTLHRWGRGGALESGHRSAEVKCYSG
jgi:hypothetical protein